MTKQFIMLSGLPRSGSQVLASMLNQHPAIYASTTSPVADLITIVGDNWPALSQTIVDPDPDQHANIISGVLHGAYAHINKPVIVDKNRLWPRIAPSIKVKSSHRIKIICTVRSIPEIIASYILLINKNQDHVTFIDQDLISAGSIVNNKNRCRLIWEKYVNHPYTSFRMGYNSPDLDLCIVNYDQIVNHSQHTMDKICDFINIESCSVDTGSMQPMLENDQFHGGLTGLHEVRPVMQRTSPAPEQVIGHELTKLYTDMRLEFWNSPRK